MCLLPSGLCVLQEFGRCYVGDMIYCSVSACSVTVWVYVSLQYLWVMCFALIYVGLMHGLT